MFIRKLGHASPSCAGGAACPDILELEGGDFAVIGSDITDEAMQNLLPGTGCGPTERIVRIPRQVLIGARSDIPVV